MRRTRRLRVGRDDRARHRPEKGADAIARLVALFGCKTTFGARARKGAQTAPQRARQRNGRKRTCVNKASPRFYRAGRRLSGRLLSESNVDGSLVNNAGESHSATAPSLWGTAFNKSASSRTNNASNVRLSGDNAATTEICKSFFWFLARAPYVCAPSLGFGWEKAEKTTREHWNKNRDICAF